MLDMPIGNSNNNFDTGRTAPKFPLMEILTVMAKCNDQCEVDKFIASEKDNLREYKGFQIRIWRDSPLIKQPVIRIDLYHPDCEVPLSNERDLCTLETIE